MPAGVVGMICAPLHLEVQYKLIAVLIDICTIIIIVIIDNHIIIMYNESKMLFQFFLPLIFWGAYPQLIYCYRLKTIPVLID